MVASPRKPYSLSDWQLGYQASAQEGAAWLDVIAGSVPNDLVGTLWRNGPGRLEINGNRYGHPFDGDGFIQALSFTGEGVHWRGRYVQTPELQAELAAGKILYRGVFGTQKPGGMLANLLDFRFKNPANTNVIYHGGKLLALWEASSPYWLDPETLATLGRLEISQNPQQPFTAHPRLDPASGDLIAFGVRTGLGSTLHTYRIRPNGEIVTGPAHQVPGFCFLHDFVITPRYQIYFQNPVSFNPLPFALGMQSAGTCIQVDPKAPTRIWIFDEQGQRQVLETAPGFIFHHVNAYEADATTVIVDSIYYDDYLGLEPGQDFLAIDFEDLPAGHLCRFSLDLAAGTVTKTELSDRACEFPAINPNYVGQAHRYVYLGAADERPANAPLQAIAKFDTHTHTSQLHTFAPRGFLAGDPVFVSRPAEAAEDDGWLLVLILNTETERNELVILDAVTLAHQATVALPDIVPYGLHGSFTAGFVAAVER